MVDKFAAVIGMEAAEAERKLRQHRLQHRHQPRFTDLRRGPDHLPLRHLIHGIDVINTFHPIPIALMYRVHAQVARPSFRLWRSTLADCNLRWARWLIHDMLLPVRPALP